VDGTAAAVGNAVLMKEIGVDPAPLLPAADGWRQRGASVVYVASQGQLLGLIAIADPIKESTPQAARGAQGSGHPHRHGHGRTAWRPPRGRTALKIDEIYGKFARGTKPSWSHA